MSDGVQFYKDGEKPRGGSGQFQSPVSDFGKGNDLP
jgi:hypothetical protein